MYRVLLITLLIGAVACGGSAPESPPPSAEYQPAPGTPPDAASPPLLQPDKVEAKIEKAQPKPLDVPGAEQARAFTQQFYRGEFQQLHDRFSSEMKATMSVENLRSMHEHMTSTYGKETRLLDEQWAKKRVTDQATGKKEEYRAFVRFARFDNYDGPIEVLWILRPDDSIGGFFLRPAKKEPPPPAQKSG